MDTNLLANLVRAVGEQAISLGTLLDVSGDATTGVEFHFDRDPGENWHAHLYRQLVIGGSLTTEQFSSHLTVTGPLPQGRLWVVRVMFQQ